jgi:hypothetical protein
MKLIYFMRPVGLCGPIKIGCSAIPFKRLQNISRWSPVPLEIIASCAGTHADERHLHKMFKAHRFHHEWFHANPELDRLIERIEEGEPLTSIIGVSPPNRAERWKQRHAQQGAAA